MTKQRKRRHESGTPEKEKEKEDGASEELKAFIESTIGEAVKEIKEKIDQKISGIEVSLNFAHESISETKQKVAALEKELREMQEDWRNMQGRMAELERESEDAEKLRRKSQLIFLGRDLHIPENDDRLVVSVAALINRLLELDVAPGEIVYVKRLPKNRLLVSFAGAERGSLRDQVFRAKQKLRGHKIFINENLTPSRQDALNFLLYERRQGKLSTVLTRGGEVLFARRREDRLTKVRNREEAEYMLGLLSAAVPPRSAVPALASAPDPPRSNDPGRESGAPFGAAGPPHAGESAGGGESGAPARSRPDTDGRPAMDRRRTVESQPEPTLPMSVNSGPEAVRRSGGSEGAAQPEPMETTGPAPSARVEGAARDNACSPDLGSPLSGLSGWLAGIGREDGTSAAEDGRSAAEDGRSAAEDAGGVSRLAAATDGPTRPDAGVPAPEQLRLSQPEGRWEGGEPQRTDAGVSGEESRVEAGATTGQNRGCGRTSSLPPNQRVLGEARVGRGGESGGGAGGMCEGSNAEQRCKPSGKSRGDIRSYLR